MKFESASLRRTGLSIAGEPLVYFDGEQLIDLYGIVKNPYQRIEGQINRPPIGTSSPEVQIAVDDVAEPKQGDLIFRGARTAFEGVFTWQVASPRPDESEGMVTLIVKAAPQ